MFYRPTSASMAWTILSLCLSLDWGNGGEKPSVRRLHPLLSEVLQINLDIERFHTLNAALVCAYSWIYTYTHTVLSPIILMDRVESVRYMEEDWDEEWSIRGHLKEVTGLVSWLNMGPVPPILLQQSVLFYAITIFVIIFVHKPTISQHLRTQNDFCQVANTHIE